MQQKWEKPHDQPQSQVRAPESTIFNHSGSLLPESSVPALDKDLRTSFSTAESIDVEQNSGRESPQLRPHGIQNTPPDFSSSGMDEYSRMVSNDFDLNGNDGDHQFLMGGGMQPLLEFNFADISGFMSLEFAEKNTCRPPTTFQEQMHASRLPPVSPVSGAAQNSSPLPQNSFPSVSASEYPIQEHANVVAVQEEWSCFRCNPLSNTPIYPKTGRMHLEALEHTLKNDNVWQVWTPQPAYNKETGASSRITIEPFRGTARDKLMAITQSFLHKAQEIHGSSSTETPGRHNQHLSNSSTSFIILPSSNILDHFLCAYASRFESIYTSIPASTFSPMQLMESSREKPSSLLLLLMIAHGAMATPTTEARYLASGLTEACRIYLFDLLEKDVSLSTDPIMLRSALLFINLAAWSGDKWHMDVRTIFLGCCQY